MNQFAEAFSPDQGGTVTFTPTQTSQNAVINANGNTIRIYNETQYTVWCNWGSGSSLTASLGNVPVSPGAVEVFDASNVGRVACIFPALAPDGETVPSGGLVHFTKGFGL